MRIRLMLATMTAMTVAGALTLNAQTPQPQTQQPQTQQPQTTQPQTDRQRPATDPQRPMSDSQRSTTAGQTIMITGCLKDEKDVPGLKPNVAERAGVGEDYILTDVKMSSASKVSGIALQTRYEIEGISKDELKKHLNHQIEVTGSISQATPDGNDETADFHGTAVKMLSATCTAQ